MTVDAVLQKLGLADYVDRFHAEQIDLDALVCALCISSVSCFCHFLFAYSIFSISSTRGKSHTCLYSPTAGHHCTLAGILISIFHPVKGRRLS